MATFGTGAILLTLFLLGSNRATAFAPTTYGQAMSKLASVFIGLAWRSPFHMVAIVAMNSLLILTIVCFSAAVPGGALWVAPFLGVNSGLVANQLYGRPGDHKPKLGVGVFVALFLTIFLAEASVMALSAIMAAQQAMDMTWDIHRALGLLWVFLPIGSIVLVVCAVGETFLAWFGPIAIGERATD